MELLKIYYNGSYIEIQPDDNAYATEQVMSEDALYLTFDYPGFLNIPVGAYCTFGEKTYYLLKPENFTKNGTRRFSYSLTLHTDSGRLGLYKFKNPVDGRLKFDIMAKPHELLQMVVDNINLRNSGWTVGSCIDGSEKLLSVNHVSIAEALDAIAKACDTEYYISGKAIHLGKMQFNLDNPLPLSYGKGNGFIPGLGRSNYDNSMAFDILYVQGGERNIDYSTYGSKTLLLPKSQTLRYDGQHFEGETGFNLAKSRQYVTDAAGQSIRRNDKELTPLAPEDSFDSSESYPKRVGNVSGWVVVDADKNFYDFTDASIPADLDFNDVMIVDQTITVVFQSGMLAGREFEIQSYNHSTRTFEIVPAELDGQIMPNSIFKAAVGDEYAIFGCTLPASYICDNSTKTGAEWDLFKEAVRYMWDNEDARFTFSGVLDGRWAASNWSAISSRLILGGTISFSDTQFLTTPELIRIIGIKTYLNKPKYPELALSNAPVSSSLVAELNEYKAEEVVRERRYQESLLFTKRRWRDLKETTEMLEETFDNFSGSIDPVSVQTMQLIAGDEALQFRFVTARVAPINVDSNFSISFDGSTRRVTLAGGLSGGAALLQHMTLGISVLSSDHSAAEYKFWDIPKFVSQPLNDTDKKYWVYAMAAKNGTTGTFLLSESAIGMEEVAGYYHLLIGFLNSEFEGTRSFAQMYGYTEVLPGRITTERVASSDGINYFDLLTGYWNMQTANGSQYVKVNQQGVQIKGKVTIEGGSTGLDQFDEYEDLQEEIRNRTPYNILLSNEYAGVACNSSGAVVGTLPSTEIDVFYGATLQSGWQFSVVYTGCTGHITNGILHIDSLTADDATAVVTATKTDCPTLTATMTIVKVKSGPKGPAGANGQPCYFHIKYSDYADGHDMNETGGKYIGTYADANQQDSSNPSDYTWVLVKGAQGEKGDQGIPGTNGTDGQTYYLHIAYATSADGSQGFDVSDSVGKTYIGQYVDTTQADSTDPTKYSWSLFKGDDGDDAVLYEIQPSVSMVKKSWAGTLTPASITCTKLKIVGNRTPATTSEKSLYYQKSNGALTAYSEAVQIDAETEWVDFLLYDGSTVLDRQRVLVVVDASELDMQGIETAIENLQSDSQALQQQLNDLNDDGKLDVSEKVTFRTQWENVNGLSSLYTASQKGSYYGALKIADDSGYSESSSPAYLSFNGNRLVFNSKYLVFNDLFMQSLTDAYEALRHYLISVGLYDNSIYEGFDRAELAAYFTAYYDTEAALLDAAQTYYTDARVDAIQDVLDMYASDGYISPTEKRGLLDILSEEARIKPVLNTKASNYSSFSGVAAANANYNNSYSAMKSVIEYYTAQASWGQNIEVDSTHYPLSAIADCYQYREALEALLDAAVKGSVDEKVAKDTIAQKIGYANWDAMVAAATAGRTIIDGGYLRTDLIDTETLVAKRMFTKDGKVQILEDGRIQAEEGVFNKGTFNDVTIEGSLRSPFVLWRTYDITNSADGNVYHRYPAGDSNSRYAWIHYYASGSYTTRYTTIENAYNGCVIYNSASSSTQTGVATNCHAVNVFDGNSVDSVKHDNIVLPKTTSSSSTTEDDYDGYEISADNFSWGAENSGRVIRLANYKWGSTTAYGKTFLKAPSGKYFYENGRAHSQIMISREIIELLGYGTDTVFYGWIVLSRQNILTVGYYGMPLNVLFQGVFIPQSPYLEKIWSAEMVTTGISEDWMIKVLDENGKYRIYLPMDFPDLTSFHVMLTSQVVTLNSGAITGAPDNVFACICGKGREYVQTYSKVMTYFDVVIADDDTWNKGGFLFQIISTADWFVPVQTSKSSAASVKSAAQVKSSDNIDEDTGAGPIRVTPRINLTIIEDENNL